MGRRVFKELVLVVGLPMRVQPGCGREGRGEGEGSGGRPGMAGPSHGCVQPKGLELCPWWVG